MKYLVTAPLTIGPGVVLLLTAEQADARRNMVREIGLSRFAVERQVEFKAGEVIETTSELPKSATQLLDLVPERAPTRSKREASAPRSSKEEGRAV